MSKFDFFEEGVRKVFENFELPAEENAWTSFESFMSGGLKAFSFVKSLILPGILATGILATIYIASDDHSSDDSLSHKTESSTFISGEKNFDINADLTQNQIIVGHASDQLTSSESSESSESTTMNSSDSESTELLQSDIEFGTSESKNNSLSDRNASDNKNNLISSRVSAATRADRYTSESDVNEAQNSNTIKFIGRAFRLDAPAKFTPNDDGINDTFMPPALGKTANFQLFVYSTDGDLVFMSDNVEHAWTGKLMDSDEDAPEGHYDWRVELSVDHDLHQYAGKVQLFR